ncbi:fumarate hydratase class I [Rhizobium pisi]|jgi:fumarate hydratase class I|uniref:Fumarate hydratase class I n=1 Tax=Rhizobium pisi TaxID=574561 RepID=A0A7W5BQ34_9HYPH|nr:MULTISPECIES: fumarate hydratase [Rhizobium]MBB3136628.1 fumarate hydratase class I [Rhizobium pisi]MBY5494444.1 fumarate hydratase [Rhizobium leguminosarum]TCA37965.1 fumarate hydratase [Rhizobium leguminosarum bv. viciae]TCA48141.1 fumarate hydratase [Rhizobium leguminosarum bv. viciae]TCA69927.1 fumarate hydratase [Rhizobium leguminosarum bv. viciae]
MTIIKEADIVDSIAEALQYISYYHPPDFIRHMVSALEREESPSARDAITQILVNSRMAAIGRRPICQDTGSVNVFVKLGMMVRIESDKALQEIVDIAIRRAYLNDSNPLRASIVLDPLGTRKNSGDNTPGMLSVELVPGERMSITVSAKGGGSENKAKFVVLEPSESISDWVVKTVHGLGAGWCPPGILGIGVGGSADKAMLMAKQAMNEEMDMLELLRRGPANRLEELRLEIFNRVNALGIGAQGLGGTITLLDVRIQSFPTHAASLPVALIPNCAATRHMHFYLDGRGPAEFRAPTMSDWPELVLDRTAENYRQVDLDTLSDEEIGSWKCGETLLLSGTLYTGRDAAHKRMVDTLRAGEQVPVDLTGKAIYYVGPVDAVGDEVIGPAGPTTATRMDRFTEEVLAGTGLRVMIGKAERGREAIEAIARHKAAYLVAVGGAAYLVSKAVKEAKRVAYDDLGMEAIYEMRVEEMPVTVAVDCRGQSIHILGPAQWRNKASNL